MENKIFKNNEYIYEIYDNSCFWEMRERVRMGDD